MSFSFTFDGVINVTRAEELLKAQGACYIVAHEYVSLQVFLVRGFVQFLTPKYSEELERACNSVLNFFTSVNNPAVYGPLYELTPLFIYGYPRPNLHLKHRLDGLKERLGTMSAKRFLKRLGESILEDL